MNLLIAAVILTVGFWGLKAFANANPAMLARNMRKAGGAALMAGAGFLALRGMFHLAMPLAVFALSLLLPNAHWLRPSGWGGGGGRPTPGRASEIRTDTLEMCLDHDTGALAGRVLKGKFAGQKIEDLAPSSVAELWAECRWSDPQSAQLLEAYLDRAHPEWRERSGAGEPKAERGASSNGEGQAKAGKMTRAEAYNLLGLQPGATAEEIRHAHRELMMKVHPDRGGTTYLAAKINEAKEVLLGH